MEEVEKGKEVEEKKKIEWSFGLKRASVQPDDQTKTNPPSRKLFL